MERMNQLLLDFYLISKMQHLDLQCTEWHCINFLQKRISSDRTLESNNYNCQQQILFKMEKEEVAWGFENQEPHVDFPVYGEISAVS